MAHNSGILRSALVCGFGQSQKRFARLPIASLGSDEQSSSGHLISTKTSALEENTGYSFLSTRNARFVNSDGPLNFISRQALPLQL